MTPKRPCTDLGVVGSILAIGMLAMALAGLNSPPPDRATEFSSIARK